MRGTVGAVGAVVRGRASGADASGQASAEKRLGAGESERSGGKQGSDVARYEMEYEAAAISSSVRASASVIR